MDVFRLGSRLSAVTNLRPAGLECLAVAARADFQPFLAARCPHFKVVLLRRRETEIARDLLDTAERNLEGAAYVGRGLDQGFELGIACFRRAELVHLDLLEL